MRIGYLKIGRSWNVDPKNWSSVSGDVDVWRTLDTLARRNPEHTFVLIGRNSGEVPQEVGLPANVENPWTQLRDIVSEALKDNKGGTDIQRHARTIEVFDEIVLPHFLNLDEIVGWVGQHCSMNNPIPEVGQDWGGKLGKPYDSCIAYGSYVTRGIAMWRDVDPVKREEVWLCPDPRNLIRARDIKWPFRHPIISQFNLVHQGKHERFAYDEPPHPDFKIKSIETRHVWVTDHIYTYDALEITAIPNPNDVVLDLETPRYPFGVILNENAKTLKENRFRCLKDWVMPYWPECEIWGKWSAESQKKLGREINVIPYEHLLTMTGRYRSTLTTPASGSGWMTAKPWESFLVGTICFFHPKYDTQGNGIPLSPNDTDDPDLKCLAQWLRPRRPEQLKARVEAIANDDDLWRNLALTQRRVVEKMWNEQRAIVTIEKRIGLNDDND
jgi:hypothetical protein